MKASLNRAESSFRKSASNKRIEEARPDEKFIKQIQRISKELSWIV